MNWDIEEVVVGAAILMFLGWLLFGSTSIQEQRLKCLETAGGKPEAIEACVKIGEPK